MTDNKRKYKQTQDDALLEDLPKLFTIQPFPSVQTIISFASQTKSPHRLTEILIGVNFTEIVCKNLVPAPEKTKTVVMQERVNVYGDVHCLF
jgi:hypothetical protein